MLVGVRGWIRFGLITLLTVIVAAQFAPFGRDHSNPAVIAEPTWDSEPTRQLAARACFDCHSNETFWPWYTNIAPISWLTQRDVDEGRDKLNFSQWIPGQEDQEVEEAAETVLDGSMPPWSYTLIHPDARLSDEELAALVAGLSATFGSEHRGSGSSEED